MRVLYAEDDAENHVPMLFFLKLCSIEVDAFLDAAAALEEFERNPERYDLVVTDLLMPPGMDGARLCQELKKIAPIPCILCSGSEVEDLLSEEEMRCFDGIFKKPIDFRILVEKIKEYGKASY